MKVQASIYSDITNDNLLIQDYVETAVPALVKAVQSEKIKPFKFVVIDPPWGGEHQDWASPSSKKLLESFKIFVPLLPKLLDPNGGFVLLFISGEPTPDIRILFRETFGKAVGDFSIRRPPSFTQNSVWTTPDKDICLIFNYGDAKPTQTFSGFYPVDARKTPLIDDSGKNWGCGWRGAGNGVKSRIFKDVIEVKIDGKFRRFHSAPTEESNGKKVRASDYDRLPPLTHGSEEYSGWTTQKSEAFYLTQILSTTKTGDKILDLYAGSGSLSLTAEKLDRGWVAVDNNPKSIKLICERLSNIGQSRSLDQLYEDKPGTGIIIQWEQLRPAIVNDPRYSTPIFPKEASPFKVIVTDKLEPVDFPTSGPEIEKVAKLWYLKHNLPFQESEARGADFIWWDKNEDVEFVFNADIETKDYTRYLQEAAKRGHKLRIVTNGNFPEHFAVLRQLGILLEEL